MGMCTICARLTGKDRGTLHHKGMRDMYERGPRAAFQEISPRLMGNVIEIGCGTGVLFADYPDTARVAAVEPALDFLPLARAHAADARAHIDVFSGDAHQLSFENDSFDAGVFHFVLCSIPDPRRALAEAMRVLKPGGLLYVYEHVISRNRLVGGCQNLINPLWRWCSEGCNINRDTGAAVRSLPLSIEADERRTLRVPWMPPIAIARLIARTT